MADVAPAHKEVQADIVGAAAEDDLPRLRLRSPQKIAAQEEGRKEELQHEEEEDTSGVRQEPLTESERRWGLWLAASAPMDFGISGAILIGSCMHAYADAGVSLWCMAIQAVSHLISSVMLMLRFCGENSLTYSELGSQAGLLRRRRRHFLHREQALSVIVGLAMMLSSVALLFKAMRKIKFWNHWYQDELARKAMDRQVQWATEFLSWYGFSMYLLQAVFRFVAARKIRRALVWNSFIVSIVSLLFMFVLGLAASYQKEWSWKAEPIAAMALAVVAFVEGIRMVFMHLDDVDQRLRHDPRA